MIAHLATGAIAATVAAAALVACEPIAKPAIAPNGVRCTTYVRSQDPNAFECMERVRGRGGVRCSGAFGPTIKPTPPGAPPVSYGLAELQRGRYRSLVDASTLHLMQWIAASRRSTAIRVAFPVHDNAFVDVIYDASQGPCADTFYEVLNNPRPSHVYYNPGDSPYALIYGPGDVFSSPYPWFRSKRG